MEPDPADDALLLRAHVAGDPHAFARLYDRYDSPCHRFIRRTLASAHADAADDLHQETWIAVSRNAASFDPARASFRAWLFTIARNKVFDHLRRQKVAFLGVTEDDAAMTVADPGPTPLEQAASRELAQRIIDAVEALGADPADVAPDYWRHVHNRLTVGEAPRAYCRDQHRAWLRRRGMVA